MMAMWADHLESIPRPEDINVEDGVEVSLYWYRCRHCINVGEGEYSCAVYSNRPNTCANYKPSWMGGYLSDKRQIVYRECSYLQEWLGGEQLEVLQDKMVQLVKEVNSA
jgi:Fe-S-cluster containining protein